LEPDYADTIITPSHYSRYTIEPIEFIMVNDLPFHVGSIIKYACRAGFKSYEGKDEVEAEKTDLLKIIRYCEMRINQLNEEGIL
jgi:hypothetical protein